MVLAGRAEAWGNFGHEAIALIAWDELAPAKENELNKIFAGAPSIYGGKTGIDALMFAATWPDVLREGHEHGGTLDVPL
ncbi:MAG TPA: S1/P1 nuclease, partial [Opitutaceae bacterium]